ncbi:uncharacterized protein LOC129258568 isoform X2 [Lytechinus pictus]|uniref:uncharacterized protein LOC129258568 isoform X2 n=1 Tax=Lytechinus pictus TaxID=7653 RepID=UPI0030B9D418
MSADIYSIKPLTEDPKRYEDVYYNVFYKIAQKDVVLEKVNQYFDNKVIKMLTDVFGCDEEFSLLGVGVGEGPHEFHFLKSLQSYYSSICNVAVDPNEGDFETTFTQMTSMMKDNGFIIIVCKNDSLNTKTFHKLPWLSESTQSNERLSSKTVREFAESQGYNVTTVDISVQWDITELFKDQSEFGDKLLDFCTQAAYFRQTAPATILDDLIAFWRSISTQDDHGRVFAPAHDEILLVSK